MKSKLRASDLQRLNYLQSHIPQVQREQLSLQRRVTEEFSPGITEVAAGDDVFLVTVPPPSSEGVVTVKLKNS